jgi:hypothetical protein
MPAKKHSSLNNRNDTKADIAARTKAESAMTPKTELSLKPPGSLNGHKLAVATWKRVVGLYLEIEGKIATSFDSDVLVKYCLLEEEVVRFATMRDETEKDWKEQRKAAMKIKPNKDTLKDWVAMWGIVNALGDKVIRYDARLDGKRKLLHTLSQSLYLTPRSRAGVEPPTKPAEQPKSEMEKALDG